jgi:hypothetical protein
MAEHSLNVTYAWATLSDLKLFASQLKTGCRKHGDERSIL